MKHTLYFYGQKMMERFEKEFELTVPKPLQPFDSWTWDENTKTWNAPTPYPSDNNNYTWNEDDKEWILTEDNT